METLTTVQAFELEQLQQRLQVSDGALLAFARQFENVACCGKFTLADLTDAGAAGMIRELRFIEQIEQLKIKALPVAQSAADRVRAKLAL